MLKMVKTYKCSLLFSPRSSFSFSSGDFFTVTHITVSYILKGIMRWYIMKNGNYSWISIAGKQSLKTDTTIKKKYSVCCKEKKSLGSSEFLAIHTGSACGLPCRFCLDLERQKA